MPLYDLPQYHRRAFAHDYHAPFIYHIILKKMKDCDSFGLIQGDAKIPPGSQGCAYVKESPLGSIIAKAIVNLPKHFPIMQIYQYSVMPDHVHILLCVKERSAWHLDYYIDYLEANISGNYSRIIGKFIKGEEIFQPGYCDKPLLLGRSLDVLFKYIRENPHRLAVRKQFPQFFRTLRKLRIGNYECQAYGNLFLLRNPFKEQVVVHRADGREVLEGKRACWMHAAANGGVLVSPFISEAEKKIRAEAEALGSKIILIVHEGFGERFKPADHDFNLCCQGLLLLLSLGLPSNEPLSRSLCLQMNDLAQYISLN